MDRPSVQPNSASATADNGAAPPPPPQSTPTPAPSPAATDRGRRLVLNTASSYARLGGTFLVGLVITPALQRPDGIGTDGFGVYSGIMSGVGLVAFLETAIRSGLTRELSDAWHSDVPGAMRRRYSAAIAASLILVAITVPFMLITAPFTPTVFNAGPLAVDLMWAWAIQGLALGVGILTAPSITLFIAMDRIPVTNIIMFLERATSLLGLLVFLTPFGRAHPLAGYVLVEAGTTMIVRIIAALVARRACPAARFSRADVHRSEVRQLLRTGGDVVKSIVGTNLFFRANQLLIIIIIGKLASALTGNVFLLVGYTRMAAMSLAFGVEPQAARAALSKQAAPRKVGELLLIIVRIQAGVVLPLVALLGGLAGPILAIWLSGTETAAVDGAIDAMAIMLQVALIGSPFLVVMHGAMRVMLGAGDVRHYANMLILGGALQVTFAIAILLAAPPILDRFGVAGREAMYWTLYAVVAEMSLAYLAIYGVRLPLIACRLYSLRAREMYLRAIGPGAIVAIVVAALAGTAVWRISEWTLLRLALVAAIAGLIGATMAWLIVLRSNERARLLSMAPFGVARRASKG